MGNMIFDIEKINFMLDWLLEHHQALDGIVLCPYVCGHFDQTKRCPSWNGKNKNRLADWKEELGLDEGQDMTDEQWRKCFLDDCNRFGKIPCECSNLGRCWRAAAEHAWEHRTDNA